MKVLALDPATACGWAIGDLCGVWDISMRRDESSGMRLIRLRGKLNELHAAEKIELVVFEAARHAAQKMQGALCVAAEIQGVIKVWCEDQNPSIPFKGYSPSEIKKHATGKGNCDKAAMLDAARQKWTKIHFEDHNAADAKWLLDMVETQLRP